MEWVADRYGEAWTLRLTTVLALRVVREVQNRDNPSPTPYSASMFGARLAKRFATPDEAKVAVIKAAESQLVKAVANLPHG